ncbi:hypothetical protein TUMSATVNIG1_41170 [Vibrio nigripulchritudo]|uniref:hypothetical protein n=1 Tax=Vibrio nigripulchritudo TaxID=28173 RepID=UPI00190DCC6C|nr:hypothetical protein [Vibrio nigripulchritudo]BCL72150.1 hypothetical protein VNTUMSATTG_40870 [Vibrio nigripulchritudo]BDU33508.1 hypothetical protein TUMSATVNIG1_41170 [Vibrio nigripulchritudo]
MTYVTFAFIFVFLVFVVRAFSFRKKSTNCAIDALKATVNTLPEESTPSKRVMVNRLTSKYQELSHRIPSNDIRDYAEKMLMIQKPQPEHIAMLLLMSVSTDFKHEQNSANVDAYADIAKWCEAAYDHLATADRVDHETYK